MSIFVTDFDMVSNGDMLMVTETTNSDVLTHKFRFIIDDRDKGYIVHETWCNNKNNVFLVKNAVLYGPFEWVNSKFIYIDDNSKVVISDKRNTAELELAMLNENFTVLKLTVKQFNDRFDKQKNNKVIKFASKSKSKTLPKFKPHVGDDFMMNHEGDLYAITIIEDETA